MELGLAHTANVQGRLARLMLACVLAFALVPLAPTRAAADDAARLAIGAAAGQAEPVLAQADGFEPYSGWQMTSDPNGHSGGGTEVASGCTAWQLVSPPSAGTVSAEGSSLGFSQGDVDVVVDTTKTKRMVAGARDEQTGLRTYEAGYVKNVILPMQDLDGNGDGTVGEGDAVTFEFLTMSTGGRSMTSSSMYGNYAPATGRGGVVVSTSDDPADWSDASKVLWTGSAGNTAVGDVAAGGNWMRRVSFAVPSTVLENAGDTFYLALQDNLYMGNANLCSNIVFQFGTSSSAWSGDVAKAGGVSAQGDAVVVGMVDPAPEVLTRDLTAMGYWRNSLRDGAVQPDEQGAISFNIVACASGGNWQSASSWDDFAFGVYDDDPVANEAAVLVADNKDIGGVAITAGDDIWSEGAKLTVSGLVEGAAYYLEVPAGFRAGNSNELAKPIVYRFAVGEESDPGPQAGWDVSREGDGSLVARLSDDGVLALAGSGAMRDFADASEVPWADRAGEVREVRLPRGLSSIGDHAFSNLANEALAAVRVPGSVTSIGAGAFAGCTALAAVDLTACASLERIGEAAFYPCSEGVTLYFADTVGASKVEAATAEGGAYVHGNAVAARTALAIVNGGSLPADAAFGPSELAGSLDRADHVFLGWCTDAALMHPATSWSASETRIGGINAFFARFKERETIDEPVEYPGAQGDDQKVMLDDVSKLPRQVVKQPGILYYGVDAEHYDNRIQSAYNGNKDIVFAFSMARGNNANGGDGSYVVSFSMPYISILDDRGAVVASYDNGYGALKLFKIIFDGDESKTQGNSVYSMKIGVEAGALDEGVYTLRFGKDLGANNGLSFLGTNVDFQFTVQRPAEYELTYDDGGTAVTGVSVKVDYPVDVVVPEGVTAIAAGAFADADSVRSVSLPASTASIGDGAFSSMDALEWVKVLGDAPDVPVFGAGVFDGSRDLVLYGYAAAATVADVALAYANVTYAPLDDGIYVNNRLFREGDEIALTREAPDAVVSVFRDGADVTGGYLGCLTNVNAVAHAGIAPGEWQSISARANGTCELVLKAPDGAVFATLPIAVSGFDEQAATSRQGVTRPQGNGSTIRLETLDAAGTRATVEAVAYDEMAYDYFDDYVREEVDATLAQFTFTLGGPGSAWDCTRWNWDDWTANHLNAYITLVDGEGAIVATVGDGLYWITLTNSNAITLGVERGVLQPGSTYTLVFGPDVTGHNVAARLLKGVHWTFKAKATDLSALSVAPETLPDCAYTGEAIRPELYLSGPVPAVTLWSESDEKPVATEAGSYDLVRDADFRLDYLGNVDGGTATVTVSGMGQYAGSLTKRFRIVRGWWRLAGDTRYATMGAIVAKSFEKSDWAVLVTGQNYPDALSAAALAGMRECPVVLTEGTRLSAEARAALERLGVGHVYVTGGEKAVSAEVEAEVRAMGVEVERIAGSDRVRTSLAVMDEVKGRSDTVIVAAGYRFADALSIGPWSYASTSPIVLVGKDGLLTQGAVDAIREAGYARYIVVGGPKAVSEAVDAQLRGLQRLARLQGPTRYETSAEIVRWSVAEGGLSLAQPCIAYGEKFPDALAGTPLAGSSGSVIVLVKDEGSSGIAVLQDGKDAIRCGYALGGPRAIPDSLAAAVARCANMTYEGAA